MTRVWRDSQGRSRSETAKPGVFNADKRGRFILTEIWDPVGRIVYILDDEVKTAYRFAAAVGAREPPVANAEPAPVPATGATVTEKLGLRNIEGVMAEGTRRTKTIPIGAIGNDRPLVSTSEEWYSPELKREVLYTFSDPRSGDRTRRTIKIIRSPQQKPFSKCRITSSLESGTRMNTRREFKTIPANPVLGPYGE